ncbi:MAG: HIT family protein [Clostridiales bacterium]|jgi:histidine triad (HIT) family protein|nr:HIT family protein [Clostridiales bacterium]
MKAGDDMDCLFCRIASGELPSDKLYEDDSFIIILDAFPSSLGHALIIPKKHVDDIFELDEEEGAAMFKLVARYAKKIKNALNCDGLNVLQNSGAAAGQTVFHFHMHIIPRYVEDNVNIGWKVSKPGGDSIQHFIKKLR